VTFLGRLDERRKGLPVFLAAAPLIRASIPEVTVTVAGAGTAVLPRWVEATGPLTDAQRNDVLRGTDVLVAPNIGSESFGLILVEALAAGAAVVASDLPAFRDVLTGPTGPVGTTFPTGDAAALARAVVAALAATDESGVERAGREERAREFDWDVVGPAYLAVYARAVRSVALRPSNAHVDPGPPAKRSLWCGFRRNSASD
jgi:phosphatidylinositol alpha-mannosyltransferase